MITESQQVEDSPGREWTPETVAELFNYNIIADAHNAALAAVKLNTIAEDRALTHDTICDLQDQLAAERQRREQANKIRRETQIQLARGIAREIVTTFTSGLKVNKLEVRLLSAQAAIEAEPELPGDMPEQMWATVQKDKDAAIELLRIVVRLTKQGISDRLGSPNLLHQHDAEVRKPLVDALEYVREQVRLLLHGTVGVTDIIHYCDDALAKEGNEKKS